MKKIIFMTAALTMLLSFNVNSAGLTIHMFMADESLKYLKNEDLKELLMENIGAFRNGAIYPDTGYIGKAIGTKQDLYGEYSHWSDFHDEYFLIIKNKCKFPFEGECRRLFAHFLGCIAHTIGDINFDRYFNRSSAEHDFHGNYRATDDALTTGLDFVAIMKNKRGRIIPKVWHPVEELVELYLKISGRDLRKEIRRFTAIHKLLQIGERFAAPFAAMSVKRKAPWAYANYMTAKGGVHDTGERMAKLYDQLWDELIDYNYEGIVDFHHNGGWPNNDYWLTTSKE
jgi:hypothetical protein